VTSDGAHSYSYDAENRLVSVDGGAPQYAYDHRNRRVKKIAGGATTHYIWEGGQVLAEHNGSGGNLVDYVYAGGKMIAKVASGSTQYFVSDRLSVRMTVDSSGNVIGSQAHLPYGEDFAESGAQEKHHFTSYERDGETGLDYAINRGYSPGVGRFLSADSYRASGYLVDPQSWNRYSYVRNNPVSRVDRLGLDDNPPDDGGGGDPVVLTVTESFEDAFFKVGSFLDEGGFADPRLISGSNPAPPKAVVLPVPAKTWQADTKKLDECTQELFGVSLTSFTGSKKGQGGSFVGLGPDRGNGNNNTVIKIRSDVTTYSLSQLKAIENGARAARGEPLLKPGDQIYGITFPNAPYTNYTANDLTNPLDILKNQIHELGHSLAAVTQIDRNPPLGEQGAKLVKCMNKKGGWQLQ
jgi:RHS repeat-associated protein